MSGINHSFTSAKADSLDSTLIRPSNWNADHIINGTINPQSNGGAALGTGALSFSNLFLQSGGVINFNNGNVTFTHASGSITGAGMSTGKFQIDGPYTTIVTPSSQVSSHDTSGQAGIAILASSFAIMGNNINNAIAIIHNTTSGGKAYIFIGGGSVQGMGNASAGAASDAEYTMNSSSPAASKTGIAFSTTYNIYNGFASTQTYKIFFLKVA